MTLTTTDTQHDRKTALSEVSLVTLIERIERAIRPLDGHSEGPDHDRVRVFYSNLVRTCSSDPLARARRAVLYELLYPILAVSDPTLHTDAGQGRNQACVNGSSG